MNQEKNIFSTDLPWNKVADGYVDTTMHNLSVYAETVIELADLKPNWRVLDLACGPGTASLQMAAKVKEVVAQDFSEQMLVNFQKKIEGAGFKNIEIFHGDGQNLVFSDNSFNACFSMFGLMFFPDRIKGFSELRRVLKKDSKAYVTSWAPIEKSSSMKLMIEAMSVINYQNEQPKKAISSLEDENVFRDEMLEAGFQEVQIIPIRKTFRYLSAEHFWTHMTKGSAPVVMARMELGEEIWTKKEKLAIDFIKEKYGQGVVEVFSEAWLGIGIK